MASAKGISTEAPTKRCSGKKMFWNLQSKSFKDNTEDVLLKLQVMS